MTAARASAHLAALLACVAAPLLASAQERPRHRVLHAELVLDAPVESVWNAWTTVEGIRTFFAPDGRIEARVGGSYEIWFDPAAPKGQRGDEDTHVLQVVPHERFAFTWSAPPSIPSIREQRTVVVLDFGSAGKARTRLRFTHLGWGEGDDWDEAYEYFDRAWSRVVLPRLKHRFEHGPIDWSQKAPVDRDAPSIALTLK